MQGTEHYSLVNSIQNYKQDIYRWLDTERLDGATVEQLQQILAAVRASLIEIAPLCSQLPKPPDRPAWWSKNRTQEQNIALSPRSAKHRKKGDVN